MAVAHPLDLEVGRAHRRPGLDVAAGAKALALAGSAARRARHRRPRPHRAPRPAPQHRDVERVEFFRPSQRDRADRAVLLEGHERCMRDAQPCAAPFSVSPIGASRKRARRHDLRDRAPPSSGNSACASTSRSRSTPGAISVTTQPVRRQLHHAALGDIGDVLSLRDGALAGEGDMLDLVDQLLDLALLVDAQAAVGDATAWRRH